MTKKKNTDGIDTETLDIVLYARYLDPETQHIVLSDDMIVVLDKLQHGSTITDAIRDTDITIARVALWRVTNRLFDQCITLLNTLAVDVLESDVLSSRSKTSDRLATLALQGNKAKYNPGIILGDKPSVNVNITLTDTTGQAVHAHDITPKIEGTNVREEGKEKDRNSPV